MNNVIELAKKENIDLEINKIKSNITQINILNGKEKSFEIGNHNTYILKAIKNDKCVQMTVENLNQPDKIIENIKSIFNIQENENKNVLCKGNIDHSTIQNEELDFQKIKEDFISLEALKKQYPIQAIETAYSYYEEASEIINEKANLKSENYYHQYSISITLNKDNIKKNFCIDFYSKKYDFNAFKEYFLSVLENTVIKLNSTSCKTNKYKIILTNGVVAEILDTFSSMFDTKKILLKESVLCDKFNQQVFNKKITIIEDPQNEKNIISKFFDREGIPTTRQVLIKDGVFLKQTNDAEYALKTNNNPTGNADGVNNLYIKPGMKSFKELIIDLKDGMVIDTIRGLHCGLDTKTGEISIEAQGLKVEDGKIKSGLNNIILTTNLFEIFGNILEVGNDLSQNILEVRAPSLLLDNITIAGKE